MPRPQPLASNVFAQKVRIQKLGQKRWILLNTPPSDIWPRVRRFLNRQNLTVAAVDTANGTIETGWLAFSDDAEQKNKYRITIEQGVQTESTEIHVLHTAESGASPTGAVSWPQRSADSKREAWMVDGLAAALASENGESASLLGSSIGSGKKVSLTHDKIEPLLRMQLDYQRAWATVGHAVGRESFVLFEQDNSAGIYYIDLADSEVEDGWFDGWFAKDKAEPQSLATLLASLSQDGSEASKLVFSRLQAAPSASAVVVDAPGYLVLVRGSDGNVEVRIRDAAARVLDPALARKLLATIRRNLI